MVMSQDKFHNLRTNNNNNNNNKNNQFGNRNMSAISESPFVVIEESEELVGPPAGFNRQMVSESIVSSTSTSARKSRSIAQRKDPEQEFFEMTVLSFILSHPSSKTVMTLDRNRLYDECRKLHKSFHEWPEWINSTLTRYILNEKYNKVQNSQAAMHDSIRI